MDRRHFIITSLAAGVAMSALGFEAEAKPKAFKVKGKAKLRIGVMSDIHIIGEDTTAMYEKGLRWFKSQNVSGVIIAGDMADWGTDEQLCLVNEVWDRVFRGSGVEKLFVTGNHDITAPTNKRVKKFGFPDDAFMITHMPESWKKAFNEEYHPIWKKEVGGFTFIGAQYADGKTIPGLEEFLANAGLDSDKPFFYIQHMHPKNTCSAPWTWGQDDGRVTEILSKYPNCIAFSGHSHTSLTDDRTLWQGAFTSVGTASMSYILPFGGRENSKVTNSKEKVPAQMPAMKGELGHQAQLMTIYDNCITLERVEFENDEKLGSWIIPLPLSNRPLTFEARAKESVAPQFAAGASIGVSEADGEDRYGEKLHQYTVHFPVAGATDSTPRAYDYEVCVEIEDIDTVKTICTKRVYSQTYYMGDKADKGEVTCVFAEHELPSGRPMRFSVRPCNCYSVKGEAIHDEFRTIR